MTNPFKVGTVMLSGSNQMVLTESAEHNLGLPSEQQQNLISQIGKTIAAYLKAAKSLLDGRLANIKELAPRHLAESSSVLVGCCRDGGVVIRYEAAAATGTNVEGPKVIAAGIEGPLSDTVAMLSQNLIHCYPNSDYQSTIPTTGLELKFGTLKQDTGEKTDLFSMRIGFDIVMNVPSELPASPLKPFCLMSVRNLWEVGIVGDLVSIHPDGKPPQRFIARNLWRLPVGWDCIEVFPSINLDNWKPEYAPVWAENDILASVLSFQLQESQFQNLDPNCGARKHFSALLDSFKNLLDSNPEKEEVLQSFLAANPVLLCPTYTKVWPKLPLGARKTDFVFQEANGEYLLVELEKSLCRLFLKDGHTSKELNHARGQVVDWKRYLEDNLSTVQRELGLSGISANPRSLVVIGRSESLSSDNWRKLVAMENESPKTKVITYDDVLQNAKAVIENLLGPLWNIQGNTVVYYPQPNAEGVF